MSMYRMVASTRMTRADLCLDPSSHGSNAVLPRGDKYKDYATFRFPLAEGKALHRRDGCVRRAP